MSEEQLKIKKQKLENELTKINNEKTKQLEILENYRSIVETKINDIREFESKIINLKNEIKEFESKINYLKTDISLFNCYVDNYPALIDRLDKVSNYLKNQIDNLWENTDRHL